MTSQTVMIVAGAYLATCVFRKGIEMVIGSIFDLFTQLAAYVQSHVLSPAAGGLRTAAGGVSTALRKWAGKDSDGEATWWLAVRALLYGSLTIAITLAGLYVLQLRLAGLMQMQSPPLNVGADPVMLSAIEMIAAVILNSLTLFDPFESGRKKSPAESRVQKLAWLGLAASILSFVVLLVWGQLEIRGGDQGFLEILFSLLLGLTIVAAVGVGHWSLIALMGFAGLSVVALSLFVVSSADRTVGLSVSIAARVKVLPLNALRGVVRPGYGLWNWFISFEAVSGPLHLKGVGDPSAVSKEVAARSSAGRSDPEGGGAAGEGRGGDGRPSSAAEHPGGRKADAA